MIHEIWMGDQGDVETGPSVHQRPNGWTGMSPAAAAKGHAGGAANEKAAVNVCCRWLEVEADGVLVPDVAADGGLGPGEVESGAVENAGVEELGSGSENGGQHQVDGAAAAGDGTGGLEKLSLKLS